MSPTPSFPLYFSTDDGVALRVDADGRVRLATPEQVEARRERQQATLKAYFESLTASVTRQTGAASDVARAVDVDDQLSQEVGGAFVIGRLGRIGGRPRGVSDIEVVAGSRYQQPKSLDLDIQPRDPLFVRLFHRLISRLFRGLSQARVSPIAKSAAVREDVQ